MGHPWFGLGFLNTGKSTCQFSFLQLASSKLLEAPVPLRHAFLHPSHPGTLEAPVLAVCPFLHSAPLGMLEARAPAECTFLHSLPLGALEAHRTVSLPRSPRMNLKTSGRLLLGAVMNRDTATGHVTRPYVYSSLFLIVSSLV